MIGIVVSYERPMRPLGVKFVPCKVIVALSATLAGETCNEAGLCGGGGGVKTPWPRVTAMPKSPPTKRLTSKSRLTQNIEVGGTRRRVGDTNEKGFIGVGSISSGEVLRFACVPMAGFLAVTSLCQLVRLCQASPIVSSNG